MIVKVSTKAVKQDKVSLGALVMYGYFCAVAGRVEKKPLPDSMDGKPGFTAIPQKEVERVLGFNNTRQAVYLKELKLAGMVEVCKAGYPGPRRYINVHPKKEAVK